MITTADIEKLAALSRLKLSEEEKKRFEKEIGSILDYVGELNKATGDLPEGPVMTPSRNVLREDKVTVSPDSHTEDLLNLAPGREGRLLKVKKIL